MSAKASKKLRIATVILLFQRFIRMTWHPLVYQRFLFNKEGKSKITNDDDALANIYAADAAVSTGLN